MVWGRLFSGGPIGGTRLDSSLLGPWRGVGAELEIVVDLHPAEFVMLDEARHLREDVVVGWGRVRSG